MKRLKVLTALAMGIMASASGVIQVNAATYNFFVDFSTKEVLNYSEYRQTFNGDTSNLESQLTFNWLGSYRFDSCPTSFTQNVDWLVEYRLNGTGDFSVLSNQALPNFICRTTNTSYIATATASFLPQIILDAIVDDDVNFIQFRSLMVFVYTPAASGRTISLLGYRNYFDLQYNFNTTYLFNYFLSDQNFAGRSVSGPSTWTFNSTEKIALRYVYTTAGNDEYYIYNSPSVDIDNTRKKYAVDYNSEFFRGESVGAGFSADYTGTDTVLLSGITNSFLRYDYRYYYLNVSNVAQQIVDAPIFEFEEEDCGSFLALNVGCFINNAFAYITNDAPIVSDAFTLLNAGIEMAAQTFGIIGEFADDNVFGVLILAGFGFIAVKWFLKND